jgi:hypothetical protein
MSGVIYAIAKLAVFTSELIYLLYFLHGCHYRSVLWIYELMCICMYVCLSVYLKCVVIMSPIMISTCFIIGIKCNKLRFVNIFQQFVQASKHIMHTNLKVVCAQMCYDDDHAMISKMCNSGVYACKQIIDV